MVDGHTDVTHTHTSVRPKRGWGDVSLALECSKNGVSIVGYVCCAYKQVSAVHVREGLRISQRHRQSTVVTGPLVTHGCHLDVQGDPGVHLEQC